MTGNIIMLRFGWEIKKKKKYKYNNDVHGCLMHSLKITMRKSTDFHVLILTAGSVFMDVAAKY